MEVEKENIKKIYDSDSQYSEEEIQTSSQSQSDSLSDKKKNLPKKKNLKRKQDGNKNKSKIVKKKLKTELIEGKQVSPERLDKNQMIFEEERNTIISKNSEISINDSASQVNQKKNHMYGTIDVHLIPFN